jgi:hypothetical protein
MVCYVDKPAAALAGVLFGARDDELAGVSAWHDVCLDAEPNYTRVSFMARPPIKRE